MIERGAYLVQLQYYCTLYKHRMQIPQIFREHFFSLPEQDIQLQSLVKTLNVQWRSWGELITHGG